MIELIISFIFGYQVAKKVSTPQTKILNRLPVIRIKFIQLTPNFKIHFRGKIIHIRHWIYLSIILIFSYKIDNGFFASSFLRGVLAGGVVQGLTFPDWKKIVFDLSDRKNEAKKWVAERI